MISCVCITYGREHLIGEAIESFIRQDYEGEKELIIINDCESQELLCDSKDVFIFNCQRRFKSIGEKRNASVALSRGDIIFPWDDDDIHLPNRIRYSLDNMKGDFYNPRKAWVLNNGVKISKNSFHGIGCFTRSIFDNVGGYPHINSGQDVGIEKLFAAKNPLPCYEIDQKDLYYIYRWSDTNSWHLSSCGVDSTTGRSGMELFSAKNQKNITSGTIKINPSWKKDYQSMIKHQNENKPFV